MLCVSCLHSNTYPRLLTHPLSNNSYEGWPLARRMISLLSCLTTRPGRAIRAKRTALRRLLFHSPPNTRCFIAEFKLNASTAIAYHAALIRTALTEAFPRPDRSSERRGPLRPCHICASTTRSTHLPEGSGWKPPQTPCAIPRWPASSQEREAPAVPSIPTRGCLFKGSLIAMNRYSGFFLL